MRPFSFQRATSDANAIAASVAGARYLAGGTTLVDLMREEVETPEQIVDINRLPFTDIKVEQDRLIIGALARMSQVAANEDVRRHHPLISETLVEGASPQLRNVASIGGNLLQRVRCPYFRMLEAPCNKRVPGSGCSAIEGLNVGAAILGTSQQCIATHPSDLAVTLVAFDATMIVRGPQGEREFPVEQLFRLPGNTPHLEHTLLPNELIVEVRVPIGPTARRARYLKVRDRSSYEFALIATAAALQIEEGVIRQVKVAVGGAGTVPWRMRAVEEALVGKEPDRASFEVAAALATEGARPSSGNAFKMKLLPATIVRALEMARDVA